MKSQKTCDSGNSAGVAGGVKNGAAGALAATVVEELSVKAVHKVIKYKGLVF